MTTPLLLDTGPSDRGWSFYGDAFRCLHLFALKRLAGLVEDADALTQGSMGHVGMAHRLARFQMLQEGKDPELYYPPEEAIRQWSYVHPEGVRFVDGMVETYRRYAALHPEAPGRVLGVETPVAGVVGWHCATNEWGLWLEGSARPATLDVPGHPEHGIPIRITKRFDAVVADRSGAVHIWDHKFTAASVSKSRVLKYSMDGQFAITRLLGRQLFGAHFGLVMLHLVQRVAPFGMHFGPVQATPWRDAQFATNLYRMAHTIAQLQRDEPDPHRWPMAQHELVCSSRYGDCPGLEQGACSHGADFMRRE